MRVGIQNACISQIVASMHYLTRKKKRLQQSPLSETSFKAAKEKESSEIYFIPSHPPHTDSLGRWSQ